MVPVPAVASVVAGRHHPAYAPRSMEALRRRQRLQPGGPDAALAPRRPHAPRTLPRVAALAASLAILAALAIAPAARPSVVNAMGPLPPCRYDDIRTSPRQYADAPITLVDTILRVSRDYVPPDLVDVSQAGIPGRGLVRAIIVDDLRAMSEAAAAAGAAIGVQSAYRSFQTQQSVFASWVTVHGYERALQLSARPGHSEHQLGISLDVRSHPGGDPFTGNWGRTVAGKWMKAHAWEYGFLMSYPKGMIDTVCYDFEPWHFRWVGRDLAAQIRASGLTIREYLWANYTTTVVPAVTPAPPRTPRPPRPPTAAPTLGPVPIATDPPATMPPSVAPETAAPSPAASTVPSAAPTRTPAPTPSATPPVADPAPASGLAVGLIGVLGLGLGGAIVLGWMVRRGRS
jgi:D-alanyl-D-alanine carboxypeptidase